MTPGALYFAVVKRFAPPPLPSLWERNFIRARKSLDREINFLSLFLSLIKLTLSLTHEWSYRVISSCYIFPWKHNIWFLSTNFFPNKRKRLKQRFFSCINLGTRTLNFVRSKRGKERSIGNQIPFPFEIRGKNTFSRGGFSQIPVDISTVMNIITFWVWRTRFNSIFCRS